MTAPQRHPFETKQDIRRACYRRGYSLGMAMADFGEHLPTFAISGRLCNSAVLHGYLTASSEEETSRIERASA